MTGNGNVALTPIWARLREEVQQPEYWKKWREGWDATNLLLQESPEIQAAFVVAAVQRTLKPKQQRLDLMSAVGRFLSRVVTGDNPALQTLVVSPRTIPLDQMEEKEREQYIEDRIIFAATGVLKELVRRRVALSEPQVTQLLDLYAPAPRWPPQPLLNYLLRLSGELQSSHEVRRALEKLRDGLLKLRAHTEQKKQLQAIAKILEGVPAYEAAQGPWLEMVFKEIEALPESEVWRRVMDHCATSRTSASKAWKNDSTKLIATFGRERFRETALRWLAQGVTPGEARRQLHSGEAELLQGFAWMLRECEDLEAASCLAKLAEECFRKIPMVGAVSHKVGNACVNVLAEMPGLNAVGQLSRLRARVKYKTAKRLVEKALNQAAQRAGITRNDLEDIAVPTFDLQLPGILRREAGAYLSELAVVGSAQLAISWKSGNGKISKSAPAEVKRSHPEVLKTLKQTAKDAEQMLRAQRSRLEKLFLTQHSVAFEDWLKRTVEHALLAQMTRRLIWQFADTSGRKTLGIWHADGLAGSDGRALRGLESTTVRLWHPLGTDVKTVLAWRKWLQDREITQPFKQAHREIYVLTDAERQTETYSNRFAAHILSQHTLNALCRERGWEGRLQGQFDSGGATPTLHLPEHGLVVEFWVEAAPDAPTSAAGISLYVASD